MTTPRITSVLRHWLWRMVCRLSGGLTVTGRWQTPGGCILVANHSSHFDTAALLAALPPTAAPLFGAAADYWFDVPARRLLATSLVGVLPVPRSGEGSYAVLLDGARKALKAGHAVVIYPEGTRSTDGSIGEFHIGALRLARECGVPLIPAALIGTAAVLPKDGPFSAGPMRVHLGEPVDPRRISISQLRAEVIALLDGNPASSVDHNVYAA